MNTWYIFLGDQILLTADYALPSGTEPPVALPPGVEPLPVDHEGSEGQARAVMLSQPPAPDASLILVTLRQSYYHLGREQYLMAGKCYELVYWDAHTRYCSTCGAPMQRATPISKRCTQCGREVWPSLATAIIVLIHRGDEILLVQSRNFKRDFYGLVAGFVETGESLEEAVYREVMEETSLRIRHLRYVASQPWPYPCGLMVGYIAEYESGELHLQQEELRKGGWFSIHHLPTLPEPLSLARRLIDRYLSERKH